MNVKTDFKENGIAVYFEDAYIVKDHEAVQRIITFLVKIRNDEQV